MTISELLRTVSQALLQTEGFLYALVRGLSGISRRTNVHNDGGR
jgi:hypothetical protein